MRIYHVKFWDSLKILGIARDHGQAMRQRRSSNDSIRRLHLFVFAYLYAVSHNVWSDGEYITIIHKELNVSTYRSSRLPTQEFYLRDYR